MAPVHYRYHPDTGLSLGPQEADIDPLETELRGEPVWLPPPDSTLDPPPAAGAGHVAVWTGEGWTVAEDHRGERIYTADGTEKIVAAIGPLPEGAITAVPPAPGSTWDAAAGAWLPPPPEVPAAITARQGKAQLLRMGLLTPAEAIAGELPAFLAAAIAAMDPVAGAEVALAWRESTIWERADPLFGGGLLAAAAAALGLPATPETVDQFFIAAAGGGA